MVNDSYTPTIITKKNLITRGFTTLKKIIKSRKSIANKLGNIKYYIDHSKNAIYNIKKDRSKVKKLLINSLKKNQLRN